MSIYWYILNITTGVLNDYIAILSITQILEIVKVQLFLDPNRLSWLEIDFFLSIYNKH